jgi:hypothetical protein
MAMCDPFNRERSNHMKNSLEKSPHGIATACCGPRGKTDRRTRIGAALACAAVVAAGTSAARAETAVLNGGFESGVLAPWAYSGDGMTPPPAPTVAAARSGQYGLEVTGWGPPVWIRQDIQNRLIPGAVYHFTASLNLLEVNPMPDLPPMYVPHLSVHAVNNPDPGADAWAYATNAAGLGWQNLEVSRTFTAQELQGAVKVDIGGMGRFQIDDVAGDLLANRSFDKAGGANWSHLPSDTWAPFAVPGEVDLHRSYTGAPVRMLWQDLSIGNVAGATGTASMRLKSTSSWPTPGTVSTKVYLDYLNSSGNPRRVLLLTPDNSSVAAPPDGTLFSTNFTLPADAQQVTGFSVDRSGPGMFQAMDFHLNLIAAATVTAPVVTIIAPNEGESFVGGSTIPLMAEVDDSGGAVVTKVEFYDNGTLIGQAQPGVSSLGAGDTLNANITGDTPLGSRNLAGGVRESYPGYGLTWANAAIGPHVLTARAYYGTGSHVTSAPVNITVTPPPTPFEAWRNVKFTPDEIAAGKAAMDVDTEGDGLVNLLEYAFNTEPKARNVAPVVVRLRTGKLEISFPCDSTRTDISYIVQASGNLKADSWIDIAKSAGGAITTPLNGSGCTIYDAGGGRRTVRVVVADSSPEKQFLRMKVTTP